MPDETFGKRLQRLRTARRLRVMDVAYAAGLTEGAIRQLESGQTKGATLVAGLRIAKLLGVTPDYLATGAEGSDDTGLSLIGRLNDHERRLSELERRSGIGDQPH